MLGRMISQTKTLKIKSFLPFNFAITKICVAIRLAEDGTRMGGIKFRLSPSKKSNSHEIVDSISPKTKTKAWPRGTCLVTGDSMLCSI